MRQLTGLTLALLTFTILSISCSTPEYKICEFETSDPDLKLYHSILTELIEQHFYNRYLEQVSEGLLDKYPPVLEFSDTAAFKEALVLAQNKVFNDTAKFETICYRPSFENGPWLWFNEKQEDLSSSIKNDTTGIWRNFREEFPVFAKSVDSAAHTIANPQTKYTSDDFRLCTSKIISCGHFYDSGIGVVSLSKVFLNEDKSKGLMYYEFTCGGLCGKGEILYIEEINHRWTIRKVMLIWIS